jgi:hypothetical protein
MQKILRMRAIPVLSLAATVLFVFLALALMPVALRAQTQTSGDITGLVTDPSGAVVPNAKVALRDNTRGATQERRTSASGVYYFPLLMPGSYTVTVSAPGFATTEQSTDVGVGQVVTMDVKLELSRGKEMLVVIEAAARLEPNNPNVSDTISQTQITELPNPGNDMSYIAQTAAGSVMNTVTGYGNFSSYGLPATSNLFTLDGMDDNDIFLNLNNSGATNLMLGQNEIAETTVVTNGYRAEYGGLAGANVNYVTRGGNNQFHGNVNYQWNGRAMNANDWFNNASSTPRPFSNANQYGAAVGGPIVKNKAFFFFDAEGIYFVLPTSEPTNVPTPAFESEVISNLTAAGLTNSIPFYQNMFKLFNTAPGASAAKDVLPPGTTVSGAATPDGCSDYAPTTFSTPCALQFRAVPVNTSHERIYAGRFDYNLGSNDRLYVRYQQDHGLQATYTDPINPVFNADSNQPEYQGQINETRTFSSTAVNQLIISGQWYSAIFSANNLSAALAAFPTTLIFADDSLGGYNPLGYNVLGGLDVDWPEGRDVTQYGFSDDFSKTQGAHTLKFGVKFRRNDFTDMDYGIYSSGLGVEFSLADFANGGVGIASNCGIYCGDELEQFFPTKMEQAMATWGLQTYAQDSWKVKANLTLDFGLRVEHSSNPICQRNCFSYLDSQWDELNHSASVPYNQVLVANQHHALTGFQALSWQPRIGFAWQPRGISQNTVIRGGVGIFADLFPGTVVDDFSENIPGGGFYTVAMDNLAPQETTNMFKDAAGANSTFMSGYPAGQTVAQMEAANPNFTPPAMVTSDKTTRVPTYEKWSLEVEQGFGHHGSFSVSYVGNHGYHETVANNSVNAYVPASTAFPNGFAGLPLAPPDPRFLAVNWITTAGTSSYNGLTASFKEHVGGLMVGLNYTWSHTFDTVSNGGLAQYSVSTNISPLSPMNPYNVQLNHADADYDVRHYFNANYVWELPLKRLSRGRGPNELLNGWQMSGTFFARTGLPYTPYDYTETATLDETGYAAQDYANFLGGPVASCSGPYHPCLTTSQFSPSPYGVGFGNVLRNSFRGPGYFDWDASLLKYTKIPHWESAKLAVGLQAYNVLNHPNFDNPIANVSAGPGVFGTVIKALGPPTTMMGSYLGADASVRMIQLTARLVF